MAQAGARRILWVIAVAGIGLWSGALALEAKINKLVHNYNGLGGYSFEFETSDGTYRREDGGLVSSSEGDGGMVVRGEFGYTDPAGRLHTVRYVADRHGYQPQYSADAEQTRFNDRRIVR